MRSPQCTSLGRTALSLSFRDDRIPLGEELGADLAWFAENETVALTRAALLSADSVQGSRPRALTASS